MLYILISTIGMDVGGGLSYIIISVTMMLTADRLLIKSGYYLISPFCPFVVSSNFTWLYCQCRKCIFPTPSALSVRKLILSDTLCPIFHNSNFQNRRITTEDTVLSYQCYASEEAAHLYFSLQLESHTKPTILYYIKSQFINLCWRYITVIHYWPL